MHYPAYFDHTPNITLYDPLAHLLGATEDGMITYHYLDVVKLTGHACITTAGAYLMTFYGLQALYPETQAQRGNIEIFFPLSRSEGTTGITASVMGLITGAAGEEGFQGIQGYHQRRHLMHFGHDEMPGIQLRRNDTGASVILQLHPEKAGITPPDPAVMRQALADVNSPLRDTFAQAWQKNVMQLFQRAEYEGVVAIHTL